MLSSCSLWQVLGEELIVRKLEVKDTESLPFQSLKANSNNSRLYMWQIGVPGVLLWCSGLRILCCRCCGSGHCFCCGFSPWPRNFHMCWVHTHPPPKKKEFKNSTLDQYPGRNNWFASVCSWISLPPLLTEPFTVVLLQKQQDSKFWNMIGASEHHCFPYICQV